jgi:osmotically-inducible protein OsmY
MIDFKGSATPKRRIAAVLTLGALAGPVGSESLEQAETAAKAQVILDANPLLGGYALEVRPSGTGLRLEGAVANQIEADLAAELAGLIAGEAADIQSGLRLDTRIPEEQSGLITAIRERTTAARLKQRLRWQVRNIPLDVQARVESGVVRLHGQVGALATKDRLAAMAESTMGVDEVFNYISVDPALITDERKRQRRAERTHRKDDWISTRLRALLRSDTTVNDRSIEITVSDGEVTLSGSVASSAERAVAESIAADVPGVQDVDSRLVIERLL